LVSSDDDGENVGSFECTAGLGVANIGRGVIEMGLGVENIGPGVSGMNFSVGRDVGNGVGANVGSIVWRGASHAFTESAQLH
jgi:hypothetical protein